MMRLRAALTGAAMMALVGCALPAPQGPQTAGPVVLPGTPRDAARSFVQVVDQVAPVAEALCRERTRNVPCAFRIAIDDTPGAPPNAFQTLDPAGNPVLVFNLALIADARNADELAFVMGHEAAHHIAGHIPRTQQSAAAGALVAGTLASLGGANAAAIAQAQDVGALLGSRTFSQDFELEADALGTEIAWIAGFDPRLGAQFFSRLPDPGNRFLGTHPPNAARKAVVDQTLAALQR